MKKIINGKTYNTDTAKCIAEYSNDYGLTDFRYVREFLYLTKSGKYFLHGMGGGLSKYAVPMGDNSWCGCAGGTIIPMSNEDAKEWAEENLEAEDFIDFIDNFWVFD